MGNLTRQSLYFIAPRQIEIRENKCPVLLNDQVRVKTTLSAISPGTELLIYRGEAPEEMEADATLSALSGGLAFPLKYGYSAIGQIVELGQNVDVGWLGKRVFAFNSHETEFIADIASLQIVKDNISSEDAVFLPNMETAVNFVLDGHPRMGDNIVVLGQGVVGLLTTALLAQMSPHSLITIDKITQRRTISLQMGAHASFDPSDDHLKSYSAFADLAYELTGAPAALDTAIGLTGFSGRVMIGSWYGKKRAEIDLGGRFHRSRIQLISSQVSSLSPELLGRWSKQRRLDLAWRMIEKIKPAQLISHRFAFAQAAHAYHLLDQQPQHGLQILLIY